MIVAEEMSRVVSMSTPGFKIAVIFILLAMVFLAFSIGKGKRNPARQTWLRVGFIFAAVGIVLALMNV